MPNLNQKSNFRFPELPYGYDALEPYIDRATMEVHYDKHHRTYFEKFTAAIKGTPEENLKIEEIFAQVSTLDPAIRNHGGGFYNHSFFWQCMSPKAAPAPEGKLKQAIEKKWSTVDAFKKEFSEESVKLFGSGFVWLIQKPDQSLAIAATHNQDNPLMDLAPERGTPLLALDLWEHAYYLKHKNKRDAYVADWWKIVNWDFVQTQLKA